MKKIIAYGAVAAYLACGSGYTKEQYTMPTFPDKAITDAQGNVIYSDIAERMFLDAGITREQLEDLVSIVDHTGKPVFGTSFEARLYLIDAGADIDFARELVELQDEKGRTVFRDGFDISYYYVTGGTIEYAEQMLAIKDDTEKPIIRSGHAIMKLNEAEATPQAVTTFANTKDDAGEPLFDEFEIYRHFELGISLDEALSFTDTEKPNAVIVYPTADWNGAFENSLETQFFSELDAAYDLRTIFAEDEAEVYDVIRNTPSIDLLVLGGHGSDKVIKYGDPDPRLFLNINYEEYYLDMEDDEFANYVALLNEDAVIFLNGCSAGAGRKEADNLANYVIAMADGRRVIAATELFSSWDMHLESAYPFDLNLISMDGRDIKYDSVRNLHESSE